MKYGIDGIERWKEALLPGLMKKYRTGETKLIWEMRLEGR